MRTKEQDITALRAMPHLGEEFVFWSEEGGGQVFRVFDTYVLFSVPSYGGEPRYDGIYRSDQLQSLVETAYSWT